MKNFVMRTLPRLKFAHLPTPVEPLERLSGEYGGQKLFIKRDDQTGLAFGGNKTRKLEFLAAAAQSHGAKMLITAGAAQSNHCRQTAACAARIGFKCKLVLTNPHPSQTSGNLLLDQLLGAEIIWCEQDDRDRVLQEVFDEAWEFGERPYLIPYGGSNPIGATSYMYAMKELIDQIRMNQTPLPGLPDWIVFASSSGGTQAGLVLGAGITQYKGEILGISVDEPANILKGRVTRLARETADYLKVEKKSFDRRVFVNSDFLGGGYGVMGDLEIAAINKFAKLEGILLDPVYTGRAAGGLLDLLHRGFFNKDDSILFWHTGGTPALFADNYQNSIISGY